MTTAKTYLLLALTAGVLSSAWADDAECNDILNVTIKVLTAVEKISRSGMPLTVEELEHDCILYNVTVGEIRNATNPCIPIWVQDAIDGVFYDFVTPYEEQICFNETFRNDLYLDNAECLKKNLKHVLPCAEQLAKETLPMLAHFDITEARELCCPLTETGRCILKLTEDCGSSAVEFLMKTYDVLGGEVIDFICRGMNCKNWPTTLGPSTTPTTTRPTTVTGKPSTKPAKDMQSSAQSTRDIKKRSPFVDVSVFDELDDESFMADDDDDGCESYLNATIEVLTLVDKNFGPHIPLNSSELDHDCTAFFPTLKKIVGIAAPCLPSPYSTIVPFVYEKALQPFHDGICNPASDMQNNYLSSAQCFYNNWPHAFPCAAQMAVEIIPSHPTPFIPSTIQGTPFDFFCCPLAQFHYCLDLEVNKTCGSNAVAFINEAADTLGNIFTLLNICTGNCSDWLTTTPTTANPTSPYQSTTEDGPGGSNSLHVTSYALLITIAIFASYPLVTCNPII